MATEQIKMPKLGESVTEGTISKWLVQVGDHVNKYDPICEVTTDKVNSEVPSSFTGTIEALHAEEGDTLEVDAVMCLIQTEEITEAKESSQAPSIPNNQDVKEVPPGEQNGKGPSEESSMKKRYSPAVLRLSQEHDINLDLVNGTGKGGRITRKDLQRLIETGSVPNETPLVANSVSSPPAPLKSVTQASTGNETTLSVEPGDRDIALSGTRRQIAANMVRSKHEAPHAWTMIEVDVTELVNYRNAKKDPFKKEEGFNLTFLPFFIKAVVESLKEHPRVNSTWAGDKIIEKKAINISLAVATEDALYVPVIKNADDQTIKGLAKRVNELAIKVRSGQLEAEDMQGGTFTVNNTGSFGSIQSQPILNYPQAAILSVESIVKRPVVINGMIAIRDMVNLCLTLDHRVLDGLVAGRFLASIKEKLEAISLEHTTIY